MIIRALQLLSSKTWRFRKRDHEQFSLVKFCSFEPLRASAERRTVCFHSGLSWSQSTGLFACDLWSCLLIGSWCWNHVSAKSEHWVQKKCCFDICSLNHVFFSLKMTFKAAAIMDVSTEHHLCLLKQVFQRTTDGLMVISLVFSLWRSSMEALRGPISRKWNKIFIVMFSSAFNQLKIRIIVLPCFYSSSEQTDRTLTLEGAFCISCSPAGLNEVWGIFSWLHLTCRCRQIQHTASLNNQNHKSNSMHGLNSTFVCSHTFPGELVYQQRYFQSHGASIANNVIFQDCMLEKSPLLMFVTLAAQFIPIFKGFSLVKVEEWSCSSRPRVYFNRSFQGPVRLNNVLIPIKMNQSCFFISIYSTWTISWGGLAAWL